MVIATILVGLKVLPRANLSLLGFDNGCFLTIDQTSHQPLIIDRENIKVTFVTGKSKVGFLDLTTIKLTLDSESLDNLESIHGVDLR
jgi:hypothetical protein